jgi:O-antigen ligase
MIFKNISNKNALVTITTILFTLYLLKDILISYYYKINFLSNVEFKYGLEIYNVFSSEGYRNYIYKIAFSIFDKNPFLSNGFLGFWTILPNNIGSAHSQYLDVFIRTGLIGLFIYIYIIYGILVISFKNNKPLFYGFLSIIFYGFFHETFKLSHGAFIFTVVIYISMLNEYKENKYCHFWSRIGWRNFD